jgi:hypothetical protein
MPAHQTSFIVKQPEGQLMVLSTNINLSQLESYLW